jgi:hypothetical protein
MLKFLGNNLLSTGLRPVLVDFAPLGLGVSFLI